MTLIERTLLSIPAGHGHAIGAVHDGEMPRGFRAFFTRGVAADSIETGPRIAVEGLGTLGEAPVLLGRMHGAPESTQLSVGGAALTLPLEAPETVLFAGCNVGLAVRNGESAEVTAEWLDWHMRHHGLDAALILDRAQPGSDPAYRAALAQRIGAFAGLKQIVILDCGAPLGAPDLPAESHPFNVPGAPGKDRMELPEPDPWRAPLDCGNIYELLRWRFLNEARAVMNIDLYDLVRTDAPGPFERAQTEASITMGGRQCYPWRARDPENPRFSDHICAPFDAGALRRRWCVAPGLAGPRAVWRPNRIVGPPSDLETPVIFDRHMALRHEAGAIAKIVPKSSLIEDDALLTQARDLWGAKPIRMPEVELAPLPEGPTRTVIVTCMKNEGPFILEWLAYHRAIGVTDFLVYTNDCDDGTDDFLDLLQRKGLVQHRDNPFRDTGQKPQHAALAASDDEPIVQNAHWAISMDVDEFINVKVGDGTLGALFDAVPEANLISCTWRLFGNSDIRDFADDELLTRDYVRCAREFANKPHQAWGFKTLFKQQGIFKKMGVHRPKGLNPQLWRAIHWVNGNGVPLPRDMYRNAWRSTATTYGYDMVQLNHYAVRSAESFLVKRDRGRVNHVDRDQGRAYWFRMNNNGTEDRSIQSKLPMLEAERARLLEDPEIRAMHLSCVAAHRAKIEALLKRPDQQEFFSMLSSDRMQRLSKLHHHFGSNVFLGGPDVVPDEVVYGAHEDGYFFTVDHVGEAEH